jgi:predicted Zn finger-like uncharacterized protein
MKVACEGCGAKYAVPEDKIQGSGRTFKVTCRQCGAPIMIKGIGGESEAKWYFAVGRDRRGPVDGAAIAAHVKDGTVTLESLAWCQGMAGWEPLQTITELAGVLNGPNEADDGEPEDISDDTTMVSRSELEAAHAAMAAEDAAAEDAVAGPAPSVTGSMLDDLFDQGAPLESTAPMHERADTSVLFSLDDLAKSTNNPLPGVTFEPGQDGEYSGLIDVRATKPRSGNRRRPLTQSPFDDGPAPAARVAEPGTTTIAVPVIKRRSNTVPIVIAAVAVLGGGAFAAMQMMNAPASTAPQPAAVAAAPAPAAKAPEPAKAAPTKEAPKAAAVVAPPKVKEAPKEEVAKAAAPEPEEKTAAEAAEPEKLSAAELRKKRRQERRERQREAKAQGGPSKPSTSKADPPKPVAPKPAPKVAEAPSKPAPTPTPAAKTGPKKDVNALLATLNKNKSADSGGSAAPSAGSLPQRLSSSKLRSTLRRKRGTFGGCYKKMADRPAGGITVNTSLVVAGSGSVKSVRITSGGGASAGVLRCISSALKSTKFPPFAAAQMSVNYPITLR